MKKLNIFIISFLLCSLAFLFIGNASEIEPLTESKALQLINDAHDIEYSCLDLRFQWFYGGLDYNSISETSLPYLAPDTVSRYGLVKDGINPKSVKELITKTFTKDVTSAVFASGYYTRMIDCFEEVDGKMYFTYIGLQFGLDEYVHSMLPDGKFELTNSGNGRAVAKVETVVKDPENWYNVKDTAFTEVNFVYEDGNWKIEGGSFFACFDRLNEHETGDRELTALPLLTAALLAVVLKKRAKEL